MESFLEQLNSQAFGARLQEFRKDAGLTQQQLADAVGFARTTIVAIEKGERRVSAAEVIKLAKACNRSISDLLSRKIVTESFVPQLRATQDYDETVEGVATELQRFGEDFLELEGATEMIAPRLYPPVYETQGGQAEQVAEDIASSERARLGIGEGPVSNLRDRLASQVGIRIFYFPMPSKVAGLFAYNETLGACIGVNLNHPPDRRNWSLAHEYGHFLTSRYQPEITVLFSKKRISLRERLADTFAECFLMPASGLNKRITELQRTLPQGITLGNIVELAGLYGVSVQALVRRLEALKRLPHGTWERLIAEGFKVREAQDLLGVKTADAEHQLSSHYLRMAFYAYSKGSISEGELSRFLRMDRVSAREMAAKQTIPLHNEDEQFAAYRLDLARPLSGS
jgi:Zn-dependent peptidase ImmA (M78 family)/DNA-binding XRE family transcriptional regulator